MEKQDLISLSPVRVFDGAVDGGLKAGQMGLVTAGKGLGKTSVLVQFGIDSLLHGNHVIHVSFDQHSSNVIAWYDSILAEIAKKKHVHIEDITDEILRERTILNFNQKTFTLPKVVGTVKALKDSGINVSSVVVDGLDFNEVKAEDLDCFASYVKEAALTAWFSSTTESESLEGQADEKLLSQFAVVSHLTSKNNELVMNVLKPVNTVLSLDSKTTLITK